MTDLIAEYLRDLEDRGRRKNTRDHYAEILRRMDAELPVGLGSACAEELRDWIYVDGRSNQTREHYRAIAHGFYEWASDPRDQRLDYNPAALLPKVKLPRHRRRRPITTEELRQILQQSVEPYRRWFLLGAYAGLRCIELAEISRAHITESETWICGKGGEERIVPTHPLIWAEVRDLSGPLVLRRDGRPASRRYVSARGNDYLHHRLGLDVTMHGLRRWFGTAAYAASGNDIETTRVLLGHAHVNTTQIYVQAEAGSAARAVAALPLAG